MHIEKGSAKEIKRRSDAQLIQNLLLSHVSLLFAMFVTKKKRETTNGSVVIRRDEYMDETNGFIDR